MELKPPLGHLLDLPATTRDKVQQDGVHLDCSRAASVHDDAVHEGLSELPARVGVFWAKVELKQLLSVGAMNIYFTGLIERFVLREVREDAGFNVTIIEPCQEPSFWRNIHTPNCPWDIL